MAESPLPNSIIVLHHDKLPRACSRTIDMYRRCEMINGKEKCAVE